MTQASPIHRLPREGEIFDGKYRIGSVLGVGGMAAVIGARHLGFDEMVAIKLLLPDCCDDAAVVERFVQEGKTAVKIRSEHVVRMLDVGVLDGRAYLVMEHLAGKDLDRLLREGGPLPVAAAVDMLLQACEAIGEAHALGIIHRDLKPANLFLTHRVDGSPCVKVLDFGISKMPRSVSGVSFTSSPPTLPAMVMGSPQYMSPEQMMSAAAADQRSDVWSLGATLYELLTGRLAFEGTTTAEVCARVLQGTPAAIEELRAEVPDGVRLVVARCLAKDRASRYANVAELARALAPFGSPSARASADSIARVYQGGVEAPASALPGSGTMKPTAKAILAGATKPRLRVSGYLVGLLVALVAIGIGVASLGDQRGVFRWSPSVAAAVTPPAIVPSSVPSSTPLLAPLPAPPSAASAVLPEPRDVPRPRVHGITHKAAPRSAAHAPAAVTADDAEAGPYDAP